MRQPLIGVWSAGALLVLYLASVVGAAELFISPAGDDKNPGTSDKPLATLARAQKAAREAKARGGPVTITLQAGVYYLPATLVLTAEDSGTKDAPIVWRAAEGAQAVISGGAKLDLKWTPYKGGILKATVPAGQTTDQLFVNGQRQPMARYPNFDPNVRIFNGYAKDAIDPSRVRRWADPTGGFFHAMHSSMWGGMHYRITGRQGNKVTLEGGWQNNRPSAPHKEYRFVENIFEELDAPGEWYLNEKTGALYFYPPSGVDMAKAKVEAVRLKHLIELRGSEKAPVRYVTLQGLTFRHAARTFMENKEKLLRTDWTTYRGGAIFYVGTEDCTVADCFVDQVGGNAIFASGYNRRLTVRGCHIANAGANGVAFIGEQSAVRSPCVGYERTKNFNEIDKTPGPLTEAYPADCLVEDCLIYLPGRVEKQTAPVEIDIAKKITVRHCSIYDAPRAGVNIGDGCWGGHVIEFCDIFDTVKETGDHGSFNSWGRDRFWGIKGIDLNTVTLGANKNLPILDAVDPVILRNTRWRCDHGWDIDLDDGSSNYEIRDNLCLSGGIKNREGFYRVVENNIIVNNSFHPHVWYLNSQDVFRRNIVWGDYKPVGVKKPWGKECDSNLIHRAGASPAPAKNLQKQSGRDEHSIVADAMFVNPARGDYSVRDGSPALKLGFKNFPMDQFGVQKPALRALARTPILPGGGKAPAAEAKSSRSEKVEAWYGAKIKNIVGMGEVSAAGLPGEIGVRIEEAPASSPAAKAGLKEGDVILKCGGKATDSVDDLLKIWKSAKGKIKLGVWRDQKVQPVDVTP